jgi:hypothetical protein
MILMALEKASDIGWTLLHFIAPHPDHDSP